MTQWSDFSADPATRAQPLETPSVAESIELYDGLERQCGWMKFGAIAAGVGLTVVTGCPLFLAAGIGGGFSASLGEQIAISTKSQLEAGIPILEMTGNDPIKLAGKAVVGMFAPV